jgi:hypothetical protein
MYGKKLEKFPLPIRNPVPKLVIASFWTREICSCSRKLDMVLAALPLTLPNSCSHFHKPDKR